MTGIRAAAWVAVIALGLWIVIAVTRGSAGTPPPPPAAAAAGPPCPAGGSAAQASRGPASPGVMRSSTSSRRASCGGSGWCARPTSGRPAARTVVPDHGPDRGGPRDAALGLVGTPEADAAAGEHAWNLVEPALHAGRSCITFGGPRAAGLVVFDDATGTAASPAGRPVRSGR